MTYRNPALTVDALSLSQWKDGYKLLLIQRGREPFKSQWAFPGILQKFIVGGFVDYGEDPEVAVKRELKEETNLEAINTPFLVCSKGNPNRDPRQHIVTLAYALTIDPKSLSQLKGDDDAADAEWISLNSIEGLEKEYRDICQRENIQVETRTEKRKLAFDHLEIAKEFLNKMFHDSAALKDQFLLNMLNE